MLDKFYKTVEKNENRAVVKLADETHPVFKAHFPGAPIVPGFIQIEIAAQILGDRIKKVLHGKFRTHLLPGDTVNYDIKQEENVVKVKLTKENKRVSEFAYEKL